MCVIVNFIIIIVIIIVGIIFFFCWLFVFFILVLGFGGHSVGVIPGLVSIPVVKSVRVLFVYYGDFYGNFILLPNPFIITILLFIFLFLMYYFHLF